MNFAFSRTMRLEDYEELKPELAHLDLILPEVGGMHPAQHTHRRWEYALLLRSVKALYGAECLQGCFAIDFACGVGLGGAIMLAMGASRVRMTETWTEGDWSEWQVNQMRKAQDVYRGAWELCRHDMVTMPEPEFPKYQAALCISSLEHIKDWRAAVQNMSAVVEPGGMIFLTMDYANDGEWDRYAYKHMRARIYDKNKMEYLAEVFKARGFVHPTEPDWGPTENLVNDYGFSSLVMVREKERVPTK